MPGFRPTPLTWFLGFLVGVVTFVLIPEVRSFIVHSWWAIDDHPWRTIGIGIGLFSIAAPLWWRVLHAFGWETARSVRRQLKKWFDYPLAYDLTDMPVTTLEGNKQRRPWWVKHVPVPIRKRCPTWLKKVVPYSYFTPYALGVVAKLNNVPVVVSVVRDPLRIEVWVIVKLRDEFQEAIKALPADGQKAAMIKLQDEIHSMFLYVPDVWIHYVGGMDPERFTLDVHFSIPAPALDSASVYRVLGLASKCYTNLQFLLHRDENIVRHWLQGRGIHIALQDAFADDPNVTVTMPFPPPPFAPPAPEPGK